MGPTPSAGRLSSRRRSRTGPQPAAISWGCGGVEPTAGATAYGAVHAVNPQTGETVVVSAAAGGVGALVTQLVINAGAAVIAT